MRIPKRIKIAGHSYKVKFKPNLYRDNDAAGRSNANKCTIDLDPTGSESHQCEILLHEIVEQINYRFELNLSHDKISILGASFWQVLNDNPDLFLGV